MKASLEVVGRKRYSLAGSKLSGVGRDSTTVGRCFEVNPTSHMVRNSGPKVANQRCSLCVQTVFATVPFIGWWYIGLVIIHTLEQYKPPRYL